MFIYEWDLKVDAVVCPWPVTQQTLSAEIIDLKDLRSLISKYLDWKISKIKGYNVETAYFWPHVGGAKMYLRSGSFFRNLKIHLHILLFVYNFSSKLQPISGYNCTVFKLQLFALLISKRNTLWPLKRVFICVKRCHKLQN